LPWKITSTIQESNSTSGQGAAIDGAVLSAVLVPDRFPLSLGMASGE
jgi:hypothetical protein